MQRFSISPRTYQRITAAALVALAFIVITGGAVRLTGSGLGCPSWPTCDEGRIVAPLEYHALVEFVNRTVTGLVSVMVILAVLGSVIRQPRRPDLTWLSLGLVGGVLGQIVLGGLVVLFHLAPPLVMGHFVLSMILLLNATVLHHRAGQPDEGTDVVPGHPVDRWAGRALVGTAALTIFLGTVVTGSGPHAGSHDGELIDRLPFAVADVARLHSGSVWLFVAVVGFVLTALVRSRAPRPTVIRGVVLMAVIVAQGAVGYAQYFTGVPALLVGIHIAGAVAVWIATLRLWLVLQPVPAAQTAPAPALVAQ